MKLRTLALATAFALSATAALSFSRLMIAPAPSTTRAITISPCAADAPRGSPMIPDAARRGLSLLQG